MSPPPLPEASAISAATSSSGSHHPAKAAMPRTPAYPHASLHSWLIVLVVFQNLYNAFTPYLTLALNLGVLIVLMLRNRPRIAATTLPVFVAALIVLAWLAVVVMSQGDAEAQVLLKYLRTTAAIVLLAVIFGTDKTPAKFVTKAINLAFAFHISLIGIQIVWPEAVLITAGIFGFERETAILEQYSMRKLGASSSYDTASIFSIAALLFFGLQFLQSRKPVLLLGATAAFVAALMSSRGGMAIAVLVAILLCIRFMSTAGVGWKIASLVGVSAIAAATYIMLVPLLLHSLGIAELRSDEGTLVFAATDYGTTGTLEALTYGHLQPLDRPFSELLVGYAIDPNTLGLTTDIGYVKFIYHVGVVGATVIFILHIYMLAITWWNAKHPSLDPGRKLLAHFLFFFIVIIMVYNYKSLELYSRGSGDFIFLLFFHLTRPRNPRLGVPCVAAPQAGLQT